jgi:hypothetical protein
MNLFFPEHPVHGMDVEVKPVRSKRVCKKEQSAV